MLTYIHLNHNQLYYSYDVNQLFHHIVLYIYQFPQNNYRHVFVVVHKIADQDVDWLERPLTAEREAKKNPPGINN